MKTLKELMNLKGRVALITGGAGRIGAVMCEALAELGAAIAVLDIAGDSCAGVAERIRETYKVETLPLVVELSDEGAVWSVSEVILKHFSRLDILVNCAALVGTTDLKGWAVPFLEQRTDTWKRALDVNLTAPCVLVQGCVPALAASGHGSVVNVGSIYGMVGPDIGLYEGTNLGNPAGYAASKGGLLQLTRWLATVMAPDVRVNSITPGGLSANQAEVFQKRYAARTPLRRMATAEDLKGAVAYLASDLSAYVTGHNLVVDGGWTAW